MSNWFALGELAHLSAKGHMPSNSPPEEDITKDDKEQRSVQSIEVGGRLLLALASSRGPMR